jgi:hypothetical protein
VAERTDEAADNADEVQESLTRVLIADVTSARNRFLADTENQTTRRDLIRTTFAAMEGLHWQLRQDVLKSDERLLNLSGHERAALAEETYSVTTQGQLKVVSKNMPLTTGIRLLVRLVSRANPEFTIDFNHRGWSDLHAATEVRNRVVHPKALDDLEVSDKEVKQTMTAFHWLLALVIEALRADKQLLVTHNDHQARRLMGGFS